MNTNPLKDGVLTDNSVGTGRVTRRMVRERATELAASAGRSIAETSKSDWEQAKFELTADSNADPNRSLSAAVPGGELYDVIPGFSGHGTPVAPAADGDAAGRRERELFVSGGVAEAGRDLEVEADKTVAREGTEP